MAYGVVYGQTGVVRVPLSRTILPIANIIGGGGVVAGGTPNTFVVQEIGYHQVDFDFNVSSPTNDTNFTIQLWNITTNSLVQARNAVAPQQSWPSDMYFGFEWNNPNLTDEYAFYIVPNITVALNGFALLLQEINFRAVVQEFGGAGVGPGTVNRIAKFTAPGSIGDSIMSEAATVITVAGSVNLANTNTDTFLSFTDGRNVPVSAANTGRIRYNSATQTFQFSENGGAWADLSGVGPGTVNYVAKFTAVDAVGNAQMTDSGAGAFTLRDGTNQVLAFGTAASAPFSVADTAGTDLLFYARDANSTSTFAVTPTANVGDYTLNGTYATFTSTGAHGLIAGQTIVIAGFTDVNFNGTFTVYDTPLPTTFRVVNAAVGVCTVIGTMTATVARDGSNITFVAGAASGGTRGTVRCPGEGPNTTAIGVWSTTTQQGAIGIGYYCRATAVAAIAIGAFLQASAANAINIGFQGRATGVDSISLGTTSTASENCAISIGRYAQAQGLCSIVIGGSDGFTYATNSYASAQAAIAIGPDTSASAVEAIALGANATSNEANVLALWQTLKIGTAPAAFSVTETAGPDVTIRTRDANTAIAADLNGGSLILQTGAPTGTGTPGSITCNTLTLGVTQDIATGGSPNAFSVTAGAHTTLTASAEATDVNFDLSRTVRFDTGAIATQRAALFQAPTYAFVAASTITSAATVSISGAPSAGANATLTNAYAFWVEAGRAQFSGDVRVGMPSAIDGSVKIANASGTDIVNIAAYSNVQRSINISGLDYALNDSGESDYWLSFGSRTNIIYGPEVDFLGAPADYTVTCPANCKVWVEETGWILTVLTLDGGALTVQPTVRFGVTGTLAKLLAAQITTLLTAAGTRERYTTLLSDVGETTLTAGFTVAGTIAGGGAGIAYKGRPYWVVRVVENE